VTAEKPAPTSPQHGGAEPQQGRPPEPQNRLQKLAQPLVKQRPPAKTSAARRVRNIAGSFSKRRPSAGAIGVCEKRGDRFHTPSPIRRTLVVRKHSPRRQLGQPLIS